MHIESTQNPKFKTMLRWREKSSARKQEGICLVEGLREVERAMASGWTPVLSMHREEFQIPGALRSFSCASALFDRLVVRKGSSEVLVAFKPKRWTLTTLSLPKNALVLVVDGIEKPGNLGAMLRTANACGVDAVIASSTQSELYAPEVVRNSLGGLFGTPAVEAERVEVQKWLQSEGFSSYQMHLQGAKSPNDADLKGRVALILGSEDQGLEDSWNEAAPLRLKLPMKGVVDSLNVSVAAGIILYEALRQRAGT